MLQQSGHGLGFAVAIPTDSYPHGSHSFAHTFMDKPVGYSGLSKREVTNVSQNSAFSVTENWNANPGHYIALYTVSSYPLAEVKILY